MTRVTYKLFLDDERHPGQVTWVTFPPGPYVTVRNYDQFTHTILTCGIPEVVMFDHDLNDQHYSGDFTDERTGLNCAKWLVDLCYTYKKPFPEYVVHSMNPVGKENIIAYIEGAKKHLLVYEEIQ
jgi:hypothetical protein